MREEPIGTGIREHERAELRAALRDRRSVLEARVDRAAGTGIARAVRVHERGPIDERETSLGAHEDGVEDAVAIELLLDPRTRGRLDPSHEREAGAGVAEREALDVPIHLNVLRVRRCVLDAHGRAGGRELEEHARRLPRHPRNQQVAGRVHSRDFRAAEVARRRRLHVPPHAVERVLAVEPVDARVVDRVRVRVRVLDEGVEPPRERKRGIRTRLLLAVLVREAAGRVVERHADGVDRGVGHAVELELDDGAHDARRDAARLLERLHVRPVVALVRERGREEKDERDERERSVPRHASRTLAPAA